MPMLVSSCAPGCNPLLSFFFSYSVYYEFRYLTWLYQTMDRLCTGGHLLPCFLPLLFYSND